MLHISDDHKLVAAGPVCFTLVGHGKCNAVRCTLDELIACGMSLRIVHLLESVDINGKENEILRKISFSEFLQILVIASSVKQSRHLIGH